MAHRSEDGLSYLEELGVDLEQERALHGSNFDGRELTRPTIEGLDELQVRDHLHRGGFDADYDWERLWEKPFAEPNGHPNLR